MFGFEFGLCFLFMDYLDDVIGVEVNYWDVFINNGLFVVQFSWLAFGGVEGVDQIYSCGVILWDWYYMMNIIVFYNFGVGFNKMLFDLVFCLKWLK